MKPLSDCSAKFAQWSTTVCFPVVPAQEQCVQVVCETLGGPYVQYRAYLATCKTRCQMFLVGCSCVGNLPHTIPICTSNAGQPWQVGFGQSDPVNAGCFPLSTRFALPPLMRTSGTAAGSVKSATGRGTRPCARSWQQQHLGSCCIVLSKLMARASWPAGWPFARK